MICPSGRGGRPSSWPPSATSSSAPAGGLALGAAGGGSTRPRSTLISKPTRPSSGSPALSLSRSLTMALMPFGLPSKPYLTTTTACTFLKSFCRSSMNSMPPSGCFSFSALSSAWKDSSAKPSRRSFCRLRASSRESSGTGAGFFGAGGFAAVASSRATPLSLRLTQPKSGPTPERFLKYSLSPTKSSSSTTALLDRSWGSSGEESSLPSRTRVPSLVTTCHH
mmetsp:Transcript_89443/g.289525  ORF Transcript_89443/g.289525 Transcript_89443/m.289525 type:complete len:223 (-) Transcript_89443:62-730(-)